MTLKRRKREIVESETFEQIRQALTPKKHYPKVKAKTEGQQRYIDSIRQNDITLCDGVFGTGKTFLSISLGIEYLREEKYDQIIISRPALSACGEDQGAYPGSYAEKLMPFMLPLLEEMRHTATTQEINKWIEEEKIRLMPIALLRGHNWNNSYVVIDEAANLTFDQMILILTRFGHNSRLVISGSFMQSDLPSYKQGAFEDFFEILQNMEGVGLCHLTKDDIVRSPFIAKILYRIEAFKANNAKDTPVRGW